MAYTPENNPYIPGDPYSYDLKWIIEELQGIKAEIKNIADVKSGAASYVNVKYPGIPGLSGVSGDGVTDDTIAFMNIIAYCREKNVGLYVPSDVNVLISQDTAIDSVKYIKIDGTISGPSNISLTVSTSSNNAYGVVWDIGTIDGPVLVLEGMKNGFVNLLRISSLKLFADGNDSNHDSIAYTTFNLGLIQQMSIKGIGTGWINENVFVGGRIQKFDMDGDYAHNNNVFLKSCFETGPFTINNGCSNRFEYCRMEGSLTFNFGADAFANVFRYSRHGAYPLIVNNMTISNVTVNDANGSNLIVSDSIDFTNTQNILITPTNWVGDYRIMDSDGTKLNTKNYNVPFITSDFIDINKGAVIKLKSSDNLFRMRVYCFDEDLNPITTQPAYSPVYYGSLTWQPGGYYELTNNVGDVSRGFARMQNGVNDSGVAFVKIHVLSLKVGTCDYIAVQLLTCKDAIIASPLMMSPIAISGSAPTGHAPQNTIAYRQPPAAGQPLGWINTDGADTWIALPNL